MHHDIFSVLLRVSTCTVFQAIQFPSLFHCLQMFSVLCNNMSLVIVKVDCEPVISGAQQLFPAMYNRPLPNVAQASLRLAQTVFVNAV